MNSTLDVLKAAAEQVATEGQQEAEEALLIVADKVAGASSIELARSRDLDGSIELRATKPGAAMGASSDPLLLERNEAGHLVEAQIDENVLALMEDMNIKPKYGGDMADDVDALLAMQKQKEASPREEPEPPRRRERPKRPPKKIKRRTSDMFAAEPSRVSRMLLDADERDWQRKEQEEEDDKSAAASKSNRSNSSNNNNSNHRESAMKAMQEQERMSALLDRAAVSNLFKSPRQEMLFRTMKVVRPKNVSNSRNSSTSRGNRRPMSASATASMSHIAASKRRTGTGSASRDGGRYAESKSYAASPGREASVAVDYGKLQGSVSSSLKAATTAGFQQSGLGNSLVTKSAMFGATSEAKLEGWDPRDSAVLPKKGAVVGCAGLNAQSLSAADASYLLDLHTHRNREASRTERIRHKENVDYMRNQVSRLSGTDSRAVGKSGPSKLDLQFDPTLGYSTLSDAKECTFIPNYHAQQKRKARNRRRGDEDDEDDAKDEKARQYAFINRQEAEERNRRDELEFQMGKAKYDARVDKKSCPQCGAKQSYDEFKEKRKSCPNCKLDYCSQVNWGRVGNRFLRNSQERAQYVAQKRERLRKQEEEEMNVIERTAYDARSGKILKQRHLRKDKLTPDEEAAFFERLAQKLSRREKTVQKLEEEVYVKPYPFKPTISEFAQQRHEQLMEEQEEDSDIDPAESFLKRYATDMEDRQEKFPQKYMKSRYEERKREDDELEPFRVTTASGYKNRSRRNENANYGGAF